MKEKQKRKKVGFVTLYGRANSGKSTILNKILGIKIQAVSEKPQTTRENIRGIYNDDDSQIIFCDTPGLFKPHGRLGSILLRESAVAKNDCEVLVYVVDASLPVNTTFSEDVKSIDCPIIIAFNKIDLITTPEHIKKLEEYKSICPQATIVEMSAIRNFNIDLLISKIKEHLTEGELVYPDDMISDHSAIFIYAEIIREKCMRNLEKEVPHSIHIEIIKVDETEKEIDIYADIYVEKESEKGIVIGKQGKMIRKICTYSENAIHGFTGKTVRINLLVKVEKNWRNNEMFLRKHGYGVDI